ncbi:DNA-binding response regulator (plasmid) [Sphingomonas paeninsulae]|jgi:two-component system response regulator AlgR|uniref:DNA-binding response regulator n=1 Tax=Sphingomonas paeninsulae TaxID=2319844 RepID=A0A494TCK9_SPHPE|nr:LytTR family DNA-binding domain-containing protein [Sphingomonas paeninsulae]AYJ85052.1 DNA-binding response regulator [Sphingomonas paeninsulae]
MAVEGRLRTLIVDDEPLAIERLQILCAQIPGIDLVGTASDGEAALRLIEALLPELVLLDISMPGLDGLGVARALEGKAKRPAIIFCTAFDQFAVAAFDVAAVGYLLKPVAPERLARTVARVAEALAAVDAAPDTVPAWVEEFWVPHRSEVIRIAATTIERIEAERDYMRLHIGPRSFLLHQTISALEQRLDPARFIRLHRSTIVRRDLIAKLRHDGLGTWYAVLASDCEIRIGRSYLTSARTLMKRG